MRIASPRLEMARAIPAQHRGVVAPIGIQCLAARSMHLLMMQET